MKSTQYYIDKLSFDDLDEEQRDLAECLGIQAYRNFITNYAGVTLTVRMPERIIIPLRNSEIRKEFDGYKLGFSCEKIRAS